MIKHDPIADSYENIENYATVPTNLSSGIFQDPVSKQCITLANDLEKIKEVCLMKIDNFFDLNTVCNVFVCEFYHIFQDFDAFQIKTNRESDLRNREIRSIKEKWVKGHEVRINHSLKFILHRCY